jgi:trehalose 6-phosphate phosphatase
MWLWVFDFDGTLSPLVPDRHEAELHPMCRELLKELSERPGHFAAVLSSREIEDLVGRVPLPRVLLGGASGLVWRFPGGHRLRPGDPAEARREEAASALAPLLSRLSSFPGVEVEDKEPLLDELGQTPGIRVFRGPSAVEVQLLGHVSKSFGVRRLCRFLGFDPSRGQLLYAGDDENDAVAMRWVLRKGGIAVAVRTNLRVRGARFVEDPAALARTVRELAGLAPRAEKGITG